MHAIQYKAKAGNSPGMRLGGGWIRDLYLYPSYNIMVDGTHLVLSAQLRQYLRHIGEPPQFLVSPVPIHDHPLHLCSTHWTCV